MTIRVDALPRPAFYKDLHILADQGRIAALLLLMDADPDTSAKALADWTSLMPGTTVHAAYMATGQEQMAVPEACIGAPVKQTRLPHWVGHRLSGEDIEILLSLRPVPDILVSCRAYDAYGEYVKTALEESVLTLIQKWGALYLVHDPSHGVLRVYDSRLLRDRLRSRPKRLLLYRACIHTLVAVCSLVSTLTRIPGWRRIR